MNKNDKRYAGMRNKLFAAIAMLLVSSIMMVSTTYAWFTLSTAPEIQGITTTVGANGNLEIALSPADGDASNITSAMGDSNEAWTVKNLTWGNLINLSDASYGLGNIKLLPARLNDRNTIAGTPLKTPVYGADGRVSSLAANTTIGYYTEDNGGSYLVSAGNYGVRAIGTSSNMTKYQITFNNYLASMGKNITDAQELAEASLSANGSKLAEMAIARATGAGDNQNFIAYRPNMVSVVEGLQAANAKIGAALYDAIVVAAATTSSTTEAYDALMLAIEGGADTLEALLVALGEDNTPAMLEAVINAWKAIDTKLDAAAADLADIPEEGLMTWGDASPILNNLMNTTGISLKGQDMDYVKVQANRVLTPPEEITDWASQTIYTSQGEAQAQYEAAAAFIGDLASNATMNLGAGSGVYAEIAAMVGDLRANVKVTVTMPGTTVALPISITIRTTTGTAAALVLARTGLQGMAVLSNGQQGTGILNETYGYIVDFMFRTNASNSSLLLQTDAAQRVYEDGTSEATLGGGSTMTFNTTDEMDVIAVKGLMECIRVAFVDTTSGNILGIAMLDVAAANEKTEGTVTSITAKLYLHEATINEGGALVMGAKKTGNNASLCPLQANVAQAVSAMVFLDGDNVDNSDVPNADVATSGVLNLQFASSADLVPMENAELKNMAS